MFWWVLSFNAASPKSSFHKEIYWHFKWKTMGFGWYLWKCTGLNLRYYLAEWCYYLLLVQLRIDAYLSFHPCFYLSFHSWITTLILIQVSILLWFLIHWNICLGFHICQILTDQECHTLGVPPVLILSVNTLTEIWHVFCSAIVLLHINV